MYLSVSSPAAVRFLASIREGRSVKGSARAAGVGKESGYRFMKESYARLRDGGSSPEAAIAELGYRGSRAFQWEQQLQARTGRHHLRRPAEAEQRFWAAFEAGEGVAAAAATVGISRSSGYRWAQRRFLELREQGVPAATAGARLRIGVARWRLWEAQRRNAEAAAAREARAAQRQAVRDSAAHVQSLLKPHGSVAKARVRDTRYWQLLDAGLPNREVAKILGMHELTGRRIRRRGRPRSDVADSGRYLSLPERLQIADLQRNGCSLRAIAAELGRAPSTVKREIDRHTDSRGRYLPHTADHNARLQRRRPKVPRLLADPALRALVQRKLNRCWSPDEICGWLRRIHAGDRTRWVCPETIYRALLLPGSFWLSKRYCAKLRTGRRIRKQRWLTRGYRTPPVANKTMIDQGPPEVEARQQPGHWEGDRATRGRTS